jgi:hypothetical protein
MTQPEIIITPNRTDHGYYYINANDIPHDHKNGEYWIEPDEIFLDQFHKYADLLFTEISIQHKEKVNHV